MFNKIQIDGNINKKKGNIKNHGFSSNPIKSPKNQKKDNFVSDINFEKIKKNISYEKRKNKKKENLPKKKKIEKVEFNYLKKLSQKLKGNLNSEKLLKSSFEEIPKKKIIKKNENFQNLKKIKIPETFGNFSENQQNIIKPVEKDFKEQINYYKTKLIDKNNKINMLFKRIQELENNNFSENQKKKNNFEIKNFSEKKKIFEIKKNFEKEKNLKNYYKDDLQNYEILERGNNSINENYKLIKKNDEEFNFHKIEKNENSRNYSRADIYLSKLNKSPIIKSSRIIKKKNFGNYEKIQKNDFMRISLNSQKKKNSIYLEWKKNQKNNNYKKKYLNNFTRQSRSVEKSSNFLNHFLLTKNNKENFLIKKKSENFCNQQNSNGVYVKKYDNCFYSEKKKSSSISKNYEKPKIIYYQQKENPYFLNLNKEYY